MIRLIRILGYVLLFAGAVFIALGLFGIWRDQGFWALTEAMSPFNVWQYIAVLITIAPGLSFIWLSDLLEKRKLRRSEHL